MLSEALLMAINLEYRAHPDFLSQFDRLDKKHSPSTSSRKATRHLPQEVKATLTSKLTTSEVLYIIQEEIIVENEVVMIAEPLNVFYYYAHEDKDLRDELEKHLSPLRRLKQIATWHEYDIQAGKDKRLEIEEHLKKANIVMLLISADFIHSDTCYEVMLHSLDEQSAMGFSVIAIILRPVLWQDTPIKKTAIILPTDKNPLTQWSNKDLAYLDVAKGIRKWVAHFRFVQLASLYYKGDYKEALSCFEQILDTDCPIPGIINKRRREETEVKGIGSNGEHTQAVHTRVQVKSRAGKPTTRDDLRRSAHEVWRVHLDDPPLEAGISSEGS